MNEILTAKLGYLSTLIRKRLNGLDCVCPNCGSPQFERKDRKYIVSELRRCQDCRLMYRSPSDTVNENRQFYQQKYREGFTTETPSVTEFEQHKSNGFASASHNYRYFISILTALGLRSGSRVFDFGCSWGYGSWQFQDYGFDVLSYEISRPRATFAQSKLGVKMLEELPDYKSPSELANSFDCFFSSHVIEHVPQPVNVINLAKALLKPGGYFVAITPNGSEIFRRARPKNWHRMWGKVHPCQIDDEYWRHALAGQSLLLASSPISLGAIRSFHEQQPGSTHSLEGGELVCIARF